MSYQERRSLVSLMITILTAVFYSAIIIREYPQGDSYSVDVFRFWGAFFLILIPVTIAAHILIHIVFIIINTIVTREEEPGITDERDRFVELRASRISLYVFGVGFLLAMVSLVIGMPPSAMFVIIFCSGIVSEMISEIAQFYFYRRGF